MRPTRKHSGPAIPEPSIERLHAKAKWLMAQMETQVWILASPAETDQLARGFVPPDILLQARDALELIDGKHFKAVPGERQ